MLNKSFKQVFVALIAVFSILLTTGCGGGGGSNPVAPGTDYVPTSVLAPNTVSTLATPGSVYSYDSKSANVSIKLPVEKGTDVNYALIVLNSHNVTDTSQSIRFRPESYVLSGSLLAQAEAESLLASQRAVEPALSALNEARINQAPFEAKMRQDFVDSMRSAGGVDGIRKSSALRASDHSSEQVGTEVFLNIVANGWGSSYVSRRCKLVRKTANCKIFVDQDAFEGLSAVDGQYAISDADVTHIANEFETHIYPLMSQQYGSVYNIDNDNMLSIVFSPVYPKIGFAGLFNTFHMNPAYSANPGDSNQRDMIGIWSPSLQSSGDKWRMDARETVAHEMQHAINFSAKVYPNGALREGVTNNADSFLETIWLDESLSVGSEARYRIARDEGVFEARFESWASSSPHTYALTGWAGVLAHYGQKGLFNYYLFEQYGADKIKALAQNTKVGVTNIEEVYGNTITKLGRDFSLAALNESLRNSGLSQLAGVSDTFKFTRPIVSALGKFILSDQEVTFGYTPTTFIVPVPPMGTAYYLIKQPASFGGGEEFQFRIESTQDQSVEILIMRLPNP